MCTLFIKVNVSHGFPYKEIQTNDLEAVKKRSIIDITIWVWRRMQDVERTGVSITVTNHQNGAKQICPALSGRLDCKSSAFGSVVQLQPVVRMAFCHGQL